MQRRLACMLGLVALIVVPAIASWAPAAAIQDDTAKILRKPWSTEFPDNLEPQTNEFGNWSLILLNYEGLTRLDEELNVVPAAAESWEFSDDGLTITFHLRENLTYSDGTPLTADRFRYAVERRCDPNLEWSGAEDLFDIVGCEELNTSSAGGPEYESAKANLGVRAPDERTLEIRLKRPAPYFPAVARWLGFIPVKRELIEAGGAEWWRDPANWVGNGPFHVTGFEPEATPPRIRLTRNEHYWGGRAQLDGIEYLIMDYDAAREAYLRDEVDIIDPEFGTLPALEADPVLSRQLLTMSSPFVDTFHLNLKREPFSDKHVREAFAYAFDREAYCLEVYLQTCTPMLSWIPPWVPGAIETDAYAFDPVKAREALAASSYGGPDDVPEITWYYAEDDAWSLEQAEWLANQFRQVLGVAMTLAPVPWEEIVAMQADAATWPQIANTTWWSDLPDPHGWMSFWTCGHECFAANIGYCNPAYDALVAAADSELDPEERIRLAEESQRLLIADAPAIFGSRWDVVLLVKPSVTGYSPSAPNQYFPGWWTPLTVDKVVSE